MGQPVVNIVWFKRDLRILDHEPLKTAASQGKPLLLLYILEPLIVKDSHYSDRHFRFIQESLEDLQVQFKLYNTQLLYVHEEAMATFQKLQSVYTIDTVYSHQETGLWMTFQRDLAVKAFFKKNDIHWQESVQNGVLRGLKNRRTWKDGWVAYMNAPLQQPDLENASLIPITDIEKLEQQFHRLQLHYERNTTFQKGGTSTGLRYLETFFKQRILGYNTHYSKPLTSRKHSSRLSPYIAWGNLSVRMVVKKAAQQTITQGQKRLYNSFLSRMRWQAHFIQKFEMEPEMEHRSVHGAYRDLGKIIDPKAQQAWREGKTGFPMVDAAMRCLNTTGFVNFRLRALLVSFFTHNLWQPWQDSSNHLAQQFLDFEPGIHYPQLQMQAGETGINIVRVYSPVKNSLEHDPDAIFLKKWLPELAHLPIPYIHEPWKMPPMEQQFLNFNVRRDYYERIVDISLSRKRAQDKLYGIQKSIKSQEESRRIIAKHTNPKREVWPGGGEFGI